MVRSMIQSSRDPQNEFRRNTATLAGAGTIPNPASLNESISWSRLGECDFLGRPSMTLTSVRSRYHAARNANSIPHVLDPHDRPLAYRSHRMPSSKMSVGCGIRNTQFIPPGCCPIHRNLSGCRADSYNVLLRKSSYIGGRKSTE
jgi:hypothetical protein